MGVTAELVAHLWRFFEWTDAEWSYKSRSVRNMDTKYAQVRRLRDDAKGGAECVGRIRTCESRGISITVGELLRDQVSITPATYDFRCAYCDCVLLVLLR